MTYVAQHRAVSGPPPIRLGEWHGHPAPQQSPAKSSTIPPPRPRHSWRKAAEALVFA